MAEPNVENVSDTYIIIGTGSQARVAAGILFANSKTILGFIEINDYVASSETIFGYPVLGPLDVLKQMQPGEFKLALGIGDNYLRAKIVNKLAEMGFLSSINSIFHPTCQREVHTKLGAMVTLCIGSYLAINAQIGKGVIINSGAIIEHDCVIGDFAHISVGVRLAGNIKVGDFSLVGIGATIKERVIIGKYVTIGAGAVVLDDIPDYAIAVGIPAKVKKIVKREQDNDEASGHF
jgi:sugar O-acyltransferase (sialic acid O-acetyltransferase NeuD family)